MTNALCALGAESGGSGIVEAHLTATITAPVFQGHVAITIGDERPRTYRPSPHSRRGQIALPLPPRPAASEAYAKQLADRLRPIAGHARPGARPPRASSPRSSIAWAKDGTRTLPAQTTPRTLVSAFDSCLALGAEALVGRPPRDFNPHDRVPIVAHVELAPAPAVLPAFLLLGAAMSRRRMAPRPIAALSAETVFAALFGFLLMGDRLNASGLACCALILVCIIIVPIAPLTVAGRSAGESKALDRRPRSGHP